MNRVFGVALCSSFLTVYPAAVGHAETWSQVELELLATLSIETLAEIPLDRGNGVSGRREAVAFGRELFFDRRLSGDGELACASCHKAELYFTDGRSVARGAGEGTRNTPTLLGAAYERWLFVDGRADSLWSQSLQPMETAVELGSDRTAIVRTVLGDAAYLARYHTLFGDPGLDPAQLPSKAGPRGSGEARKAWEQLPEELRAGIDRAFSNLGKSLAAYERTLVPKASRFDRYVGALRKGEFEQAAMVLGEQEIAGLKVFLDGRSDCTSCHLGPRFTDRRFHHVGTADRGDPGRAAGRRRLQADPFNCLSVFNDDGPGRDCEHLESMFRSEDDRLMTGAFRTPTLRNIAETGPYMHDGRFSSLEEVVDHYRRPPDSSDSYDEVPPLLHLSDEDARALVAFLKTLTGPRPVADSTESRWEVPSNTGAFRVAISPRSGRVQLGVFQDWVVQLRTADGLPVYPARIGINGGMPGHGHGLPTQPQVTDHLGNGVYLIEGLKLNMSGSWVFVFGIETPDVEDRAEFRVEAQW